MDSRLVNRSVQDLRNQKYNNHMILNVGYSGANLIEPWGRDWISRDRQLSEFWPTEPFLASAIASIAMTRASLTFHLEGPPKSAIAVRRMFEQSEFGQGWVTLIIKVCLDLLTQDNGAFIEVIRDVARKGIRPESAPVLGMAHLPSNRCIRTGNPLTPVIYIAPDGKHKPLQWYQVVTLEELPATHPNARGRQISFVSRVLTAAQIIKDITTYQSEKVSGRFTRTIHLVGGVAQAEIDRMQESSEINADNRGLMRYVQPIIMAALDPNAKVSHVQLDLASLPDAFNFDETMKWYISVIAMAAGGDFQDFAPLPGGNLGTASQSETLHRKSQRKGHALFMKMIESRLQQANVMPRNVIMRYDQQDAAAELEQATISQVRANTRSIQLSSSEITIPVAQQLAVEAGDLKHVHLITLNNTTGNDEHNITLGDDELEPQIDATKALSIHTAWAAAKTIKGLVLNHPMNDYNSLDSALLDLFAVELRNALTHETRLTTSETWQCDIITEAAKNAGLSPHLIRLRLPDNLVLVANATGLYSNFAGQIYKAQVQPPHLTPPKPSQIINTGHRCFKCGQAKGGNVYIPTVGWQAVCTNHLDQGLVGKPGDVQYDKSELLIAFRDQFADAATPTKKLAIFLSAVGYANELKHGTIQLDELRATAAKVQSTISFLPATLLSQYLLL